MIDSDAVLMPCIKLITASSFNNYGNQTAASCFSISGARPLVSESVWNELKQTSQAPVEGVMTVDSSQVDLIASTILVCAMCLAFCIGWLCHEMGAK